MKTRQRPGPCWEPSSSTPSKAKEKERRKTVGDVDKPAPQAEVGVRKVPDSETSKLLGKLVKDVSLFDGVADKPIKNPKALDKLAGQIGADAENEGQTSLTVDRFVAVTAKRAIEMLCKATSPRLDTFDRDSDDNNFRYYRQSEAKKIVEHMLAQAGPSGKLFVADWDDISSEWIGLMLAAIKPDTRSVAFAQVVSFRP